MHPIIATFGPVTVYSYGLMVALGFITAACLAARTLEAVFHIPQDKIYTLALLILVSGIAGARVFYVLLNLGDFVRDPLEIFRLIHGGLVFYGGAVSAGITGLLYIKKAKLPMWDTIDALAPYIALGHSIGRIGCLLNGCCFGEPAAGLWGITLADGVVRYPTQIFESLYLLSAYMILRIILRFRHFKGQVFFSYLMLYPAGRFCLEFLRGDNPAALLGLTFSQIASAAVFTAGAVGYVVKSK